MIGWVLIGISIILVYIGFIGMIIYEKQKNKNKVGQFEYLIYISMIPMAIGIGLMILFPEI